MAEQGKSTVTLMSGGDIGPVYEPTEEFAELIAPVLKQADLRLGQCERVYSERGWEPQFALGPGGQHTRLHPRMAGVWDAAGTRNAIRRNTVLRSVGQLQIGVADCRPRHRSN